MSEEIEKKKASHVGAWIWAIIGILYTILPVDILPDAVPVAGWIDDALLVVTGILNLAQSYSEGNNESLAKFFKVIKWIIIILGIIAVVLIALLVVGIVNIFS